MLYKSSLIKKNNFRVGTHNIQIYFKNASQWSQLGENWWVYVIDDCESIWHDPDNFRGGTQKIQIFKTLQNGPKTLKIGGHR
jgi:hypothetical protein